MPVFKQKKGWFSRRFGARSGPAAAIWADGLIAAVEERLIWDRYRF